MSFEQYLEERSYAASSIGSHVYHVNSYKKWLVEEGLAMELSGQKEVLAYVQSRKARGNAKRTQQQYINSIRHYYSYLNREPNPCSHIRIQGLPKRIPSNLLSESELSKVYESYPDKTPQQQRDRLMVSLLIYQGLNTAELIRLKVSDVNLGLKTIEIHASNTGAYRKLPLHTEQVERLQNYLDQIRVDLLRLSGQQTEQLFVTSGPSRRRDKLKGTIQELVRQLCKRNSYVQNAHQLRASRIALWLVEHHLRRVQYLAGHRYISSTERYRTDQLEDLQRALDKYHPNT